MKMQEVRALAKKMGVKTFGRSKLEVVREIQRKEGNFDCCGKMAGHCDQENCAFRDFCIEESKKGSTPV